MRRSEIALTIVITLASTLMTVFGGSSLSFVRISENWIQDLRVAMLTPHSPRSEDVVIVTITEQTLAAFAYRSPIDREFLAGVLQQLSAKGVLAIGVDILFDQATEPHKDELLKHVIKNLDSPTVVAWGGAEDRLSKPQISFLNSYTEGMSKGHTRVVVDTDDAKVRAVYLGTPAGESSPHGLASVLAAYKNKSISDIDTLRLDFRLGPDTTTPAFASYPAHGIKFLPQKWFADKIVLIGVDLPHSDRHHTPLSLRDGKTMPGVELHAQALAQLLEARQAPNPGLGLVIFVVLLLSTAAVTLAAKIEPFTPRFVGGVVIIASTWAIGFVTYSQLHVMIPLAMPTLAFIIASGLAHAFFRRRERDERRFIRGAFEKFMAPNYIDILVEDPSLLNTNGEERVITSLFTDIAGFTNLVDSLPPPVLVKALNEYLDRASILVMERGGTIDKVMGDALHVMFNAPQNQPDHPERAVKCALALDQFSDKFVAQKQREGINFGHTRIGINTGPATVGNFGGSARFDYTAHGTTINMAARLESANKHFGTRICISEEVRNGCTTQHFRPIGDVVLVGLSKPVALFEVISSEDANSERIREYEHAYSLLELKDPLAAREFMRLSERYPKDNLIRYHSLRLQHEDPGILIILREK